MTAKTRQDQISYGALGKLMSQKSNNGMKIKDSDVIIQVTS